MLIGTKGNTFLEIFFVTTTLTVTVGVFAYLLSKISSIIEQIDFEKAQYKKDLGIMNKYMNYKKIDYQMQSRIQNCLEYQYKASKKMNLKFQADDVINKLPQYLKEELNNQINSQQFKYFDFIINLFSKKTQDKLTESMEEKQFITNETVYQQDQINDICVYYIVQGEVDLIQQVDEKHVFPVITCKKGDFFGDINFFTGQRYTFQAKCKQFATTYKIKRDIFLDIIKENHEDLQKYHQIKDQYILTKFSNLNNRKCKICKRNTHIEDDCNCLVYRPNITTVYLKSQASQIQERQDNQFQRKIIKFKSRNGQLMEFLYNLQQDIEEDPNYQEFLEMYVMVEDEDYYSEEDLEQEVLDSEEQQITNYILNEGCKNGTHNSFSDSSQDMEDLSNSQKTKLKKQKSTLSRTKTNNDKKEKQSIISLNNLEDHIGFQDILGQIGKDQIQVVSNNNTGSNNSLSQDKKSSQRDQRIPSLKLDLQIKQNSRNSIQQKSQNRFSQLSNNSSNNNIQKSRNNFKRQSINNNQSDIKSLIFKQQQENLSLTNNISMNRDSFFIDKRKQSKRLSKAQQDQILQDILRNQPNLISPKKKTKSILKKQASAYDVDIIREKNNEGSSNASYQSPQSPTMRILKKEQQQQNQKKKGRFFCVQDDENKEFNKQLSKKSDIMSKNQNNVPQIQNLIQYQQFFENFIKSQQKDMEQQNLNNVIQKQVEIVIDKNDKDQFFIDFDEYHNWAYYFTMYNLQSLVKKFKNYQKYQKDKNNMLQDFGTARESMEATSIYYLNNQNQSKRVQSQVIRQTNSKQQSQAYLRNLQNKMGKTQLIQQQQQNYCLSNEVRSTTAGKITKRNQNSTENSINQFQNEQSNQFFNQGYEI